MINIRIFRRAKSTSAGGTGCTVYASSQPIRSNTQQDAVHAREADHARTSSALTADSTDWKKILRRDIADVASGIIRFLKGIAIGAEADGHGIDEGGNASLATVSADAVTSDTVASRDYTPGLAGGTGWRVWNEGGASHLEVDDISIRRRLVAASLEIRRRTYTGGTVSIGHAAGRIVAVRPMAADGETSRYRCFFAAEDGQDSVANDWRAGDLARCQTFNFAGQQRYYWRLVTEAGQETLGDGKKYNYITLSDCATETVDGTQYPGKDAASTDAPAPGDEVVQEGNITDTARQGLIVLDPDGGIAFYRGICSFSYEGKCHTRFSPDRVDMTADTLTLRNTGGETTLKVDEQGRLVAERLATGESGARVEIGQSDIRVYGDNGVCNLLIGVDPDSGLGVILHYDRDGVMDDSLGLGRLDTYLLDVTITRGQIVRDAVTQDIVATVTVHVTNTLGRTFTADDADNFHVRMKITGTEWTEATATGTADISALVGTSDGASVTCPYSATLRPTGDLPVTDGTRTLFVTVYAGDTAANRRVMASKSMEVADTI